MVSNNNLSSCHLYPVRILGKTEEERNKIITKLYQAGINSNVHYKPLPMLSAYKKLGFKISSFSNSYNMYQNEITLPLHTLLTYEEINYITKTLKNLV